MPFNRSSQQHRLNINCHSVIFELIMLCIAFPYNTVLSWGYEKCIFLQSHVLMLYNEMDPRILQAMKRPRRPKEATTDLEIAEPIVAMK